MTTIAPTSTRSQPQNSHYSKSFATNALPPSSSSSNKGALLVNIVSARNLSNNGDTPLCVSLSVAGATVRSGPPSSRHANENSFRFSNNNTLSVNAPLATLFTQKACVTVEYPNNKNANLVAMIDCSKLCIQQTTCMALSLERVVPPEVTTSITSSSSSFARNTNNNNIESLLPCITLQVRLDGPMRTEIMALVNLCKAWFQVVDIVQDAILPNLPSAKYLSLLLIPSVPLVTGILVMAPIFIGLSIIFLPIVLPLFVLGGIVVAFWTSLGGIVVASTRQGRRQIATTCQPAVSLVLKQAPTQTILYDTGSRLTPVTFIQSYLPTDLVGKLLVSIVMDALGSSSYLIPGIGESFDVIWCPLQTLMIKALYDSTSPNLQYVSFAEEFLPFTDVLPSATLGWASEFGPTLVTLAQQEWKNSVGRNGSSGSASSAMTATQ